MDAVYRRVIQVAILFVLLKILLHCQISRTYMLHAQGMHSPAPSAFYTLITHKRMAELALRVLRVHRRNRLLSPSVSALRGAAWDPQKV